MASFSKGTSFTDGVTGDVTAAKLHALVDAATPVAGLILDRTNETVIGTDDVIMISDTSESGALNKMTVENLFKAPLTGTINSTAGTITAATIPTLTAGTTTGTASTFTSGTITTLNSTTGTITTGVIPTLTSTTLITSGTGTAASPAIVPTGDTNTGIFFPAADTIAFSEGGTESMRIDSNGNVGIGTASPSVRLHVSGLGIYNAGAGNAAGIDFAGNGNTAQTNSLYVGQLTSGISAIFERGANPLTFHTNSTERLRIDSSGNVGIGTSSPSFNTGSGLEVLRAGVSTVRLYNTSSTTVGEIRADSVGLTLDGIGLTSTLRLSTGGGERLRIGSDGQIGIGGANYGTSGQVLTSNGSGSAPSWQTNAPANGSITYAKLSTSATEADNVDKRTAKAWVNFQGTGTVTIRNEFNVSSITDNGTGDYTVNLRSSLPSSNFCVLTCISRISGSSGEGISSSCITRATNSARINTHTSWIPNKDNAYSYDVDTIMVQIIL